MEKAGKVNAYVCGKCGHTTGTINMHNGTTPFVILCSECGKAATSSFYRVRVAGSLVIERCFYRPTPEAFKLLPAAVQEFVLEGAMLDAPFGSVATVPDPVEIDWPVEKWIKWSEKQYGRAAGRFSAKAI